MKKIITYISLSLILFGIFGFLYNMALSFGGKSFEGELPLTSIQGIEENNDKIYIGLGFYNRIQVYDLNGNYLNYIKTNNYSKDFNFTIDNQGQPIVNLIYLQKQKVEKYIQKNGTEYYISQKLPLTINRVNEQGEESIIKQPLFMTLWAGAVNPWIIGVIGVFLFVLTNIVIISDVLGDNTPKNIKLKLLVSRIFR
jgi:hypothetical protein